MPVKPIAPETQALLDAIVPPAERDASQHTDDIYALVVPLHDALALAKTRAESVELLRRKADAMEASPEVFALFERVKQTDMAIIRLCGEVQHAFDRLTDSMYQLDRYAREIQYSIDTREERLASVDAPLTPAGVRRLRPAP